MCIFKGIIRYRLKNTIINALLASLVQKFCKKMHPITKGKPPPDCSLALGTPLHTKDYSSFTQRIESP